MFGCKEVVVCLKAEHMLDHLLCCKDITLSVPRLSNSSNYIGTVAALFLSQIIISYKIHCRFHMNTQRGTSALRASGPGGVCSRVSKMEVSDFQRTFSSWAPPLASPHAPETTHSRKLRGTEGCPIDINARWTQMRDDRKGGRGGEREEERWRE